MSQKQLVRKSDFEQPGVHLALRPTDYLTQRATAEVFRSLDRSEYEAEGARVQDRPGAAGNYSSTFGVPVVVVSSDDQLMWLRRSSASAVNAGRYTCTSAEGMNRDDLRSGVPNPYLGASRGLHEEIGIRPNHDEIREMRFIALILDLDWWEWALVGMLDLGSLSDHALDSRTLKQYFASARQKDKWETSEPIFCDFNPKAVAEFIQNHPVTNYSAVAAALGLMSDPRFQRQEIFDAFERLSIHVGEVRKSA